MDESIYTQCELLNIILNPSSEDASPTGIHSNKSHDELLDLPLKTKALASCPSNITFPQRSPMATNSFTDVSTSSSTSFSSIPTSVKVTNNDQKNDQVLISTDDLDKILKMVAEEKTKEDIDDNNKESGIVESDSYISGSRKLNDDIREQVDIMYADNPTSESKLVLISTEDLKRVMGVIINDTNVDDTPEKDTTVVEENIEEIKGTKQPVQTNIVGKRKTCEDELEQCNKSDEEENYETNELQKRKKKRMSEKEKTKGKPPNITAEVMDGSVISETMTFYKCRTCNKNFGDLTSVERHLISEPTHRRHPTLADQQKRVFECWKCGNLLADEEAYIDHLHDHRSPSNDPSIEACNYCDRVLASDAIDYHFNSIHNGLERKLIQIEPNEIINCVLCDMRFCTKGSWLVHMKMHRLQSKYASCAICGEIFPSHDAFSQHISEHLVIKHYKCRKCPRKFVHCIARDKHAFTHRKDACNICPFIAQSADKLSEHVKQHHKDRTADDDDDIESNLITRRLNRRTLLCGTRKPTGKTTVKDMDELMKKIANFQEDNEEEAVNEEDEEIVNDEDEDVVVIEEEEEVNDEEEDGVIEAEEVLNEDLEDIIMEDSSDKLGGEWKCRHCDGMFTSPFSRMKHINNYHLNVVPVCNICEKHCWVGGNRNSRQTHVCDECGEVFMKKTTLCSHVAKVHVGNKHQCSECDYESYWTRSLYIHELDEHYSPCIEYKCPSCETIFKQLNNLQKHIENGCTDECYATICDICGKKLSSTSNLERHIRSVHDGVRFLCSQCTSSYSTKYSLQVHEEQHYAAEEKLHICHFCGEKFFLATILRAHIKQECGDKMNDRLSGKLTSKVLKGGILRSRHQITRRIRPEPSSCQICGMVVGTKIGLTRHIAAMHERASNILKCSVCGLEFKSQFFLSNHMKLHTEESFYKCQYCNKEYLLEGTKNIHERTHTGEKPFKCPFPECAEAYNTKRQMLIHTHTHTNTEIRCELCGAQFAYDCDRAKHMKSHTGEKQFRCGECGKEYSILSALENHMRSVHLGDTHPYKCSRCGSGHSELRRLKDHMSFYH